MTVAQSSLFSRQSYFQIRGGFWCGFNFEQLLAPSCPQFIQTGHSSDCWQQPGLKAPQCTVVVCCAYIFRSLSSPWWSVPGTSSLTTLEKYMKGREVEMWPDQVIRAKNKFLSVQLVSFCCKGQLSVGQDTLRGWFLTFLGYFLVFSTHPRKSTVFTVLFKEGGAVWVFLSDLHQLASLFY